MLQPTVDGRDPEAAKKLQQAAGGPLYGAIDLVGADNTAGAAFAALRKGGRLILVGLYGGEIPLSLVPLIQRAIRIEGSYVGTVARAERSSRARARGQDQTYPDRETPTCGSESHFGRIESGGDSRACCRADLNALARALDLVDENKARLAAGHSDGP